MLPQRSFVLGLIVVACCYADAARSAGQEPTGNAELQGRWTLVSSNDPELYGDPDKPNQVTLVFDADNFTLSIMNDGGLRELAGGFTADAAPTPKLLDFSVRGDTQSAPIYAIYRIVRDRLTIRWRLDESRPADFESPKLDQDATLVFKREPT